MIKKPLKIYLTPEAHAGLKEKAQALGYQGKGWLSYYLERIALCDLVLIDENLKTLLRSLKLK